MASWCRRVSKESAGSCLIEEAEKSWRKIRGADKIEALLNGVPFKDGILAQDNPPEQQKLAA
jgi:putative transposase